MKITVKQLKQLIRESIEETRRDNPLRQVSLDVGADARMEAEREALVKARDILDKLASESDSEEALIAKRMIDRILA